MWNNLKNSLPANIFLLALVLGVGYGAYNMFGATLDLWRESRDTQKKTEELLAQKRELEAYIAELESPEGITREAKRSLNLKLPGEEVVVVIPDANELPENRQTLFAKISSFFSSFLVKPR